MTSKNRKRKKYLFFLFILLVLFFSIYALFIPRTQPPPEAFGDLPTKAAKPYGDSYGNLPPLKEDKKENDDKEEKEAVLKEKGEAKEEKEKTNKDGKFSGGGGSGQAKFEDLSKDAWARQFRHHIGEGSGGINVTQTER